MAVSCFDQIWDSSHSFLEDVYPRSLLLLVRMTLWVVHGPSVAR